MTQYTKRLRISLCACIILVYASIVMPPATAIILTPGDTSSSTSAIAHGDPVFVRGIATGHPQNGLQIWVIGNNYVKVDTVSVNADNTYSYELKSFDTQNIASGQYLIIIQHPMMNGEFDIIYNPGIGEVINRQLGSGTVIFQLTGSGSLQRPDAGYALMRAINNQNIDDSFTTIPFFVSPPSTRINPIGDHFVGDKFTIIGSTNLAVGNNLMIEIISSSFKPTQKVQGSEFSGSGGTITVVTGTNGLNSWSFDVDASTFKPDEYIVKVSGTTIEVTGSTTFNIVEKLPTTVKTPSPETTVQTAIPITTTPPTPLTTTQRSPLSPTMIVVAFVLVGYAMILKRK